MELKPGYKRTDVGVIPEDWHVKHLGALMERGRLGGNYPCSDRESSYPLIKMGNLARGYIDIGKVEYIDRTISPSIGDRLNYGDVLFNTRNTLDLVGKVAIWRNELPIAHFNSNLMRLEFKEFEISSNAYANYAFNSKRVVSSLRALATGTTSVAAIYTRDLLQLPFIVPPLEEQGRIATTLSDVDTLISSLDRLIAKKRGIKQATMQQLLMGKQRLPRFGGEWETKSLGDLGSWKGGMTPSMRNPDFWSNGSIPWASSADLKEAKLADAQMKITEAAVKQSTAPLIPPNSVLIVTRSGILRRYLPVAMNLKKMAINQDIKALIPGPGLHADFLFHAISANGDRILSTCMKSGTTVESIEYRWLKAYQIGVPKIDEQIAIASALSDMDAEIAALEQKREKIRALKQGMMQELLTGRIRLV